MSNCSKSVKRSSVVNAPQFATDILLTGNHSCSTQVLVNGKQHTAIMDSGASTSFVGLDCLNKIIGNDRDFVNTECCTPFYIYDFSGNKSIITKSATIGISFQLVGGQYLNKRIKVYIVDNRIELLFGVDVLQSLGAKLDFHNEHLVVMVDGKPCKIILDIKPVNSILKVGAGSLERDFHKVFASSKDDIGRTDKHFHEIKLKENTKAFRAKEYRVPFAVRKQCLDEVRRMEKLGIIRESESEWCSPYLAVKKKDGGLRFAIDFRRLNDATIKDSWPMPNIAETVDSLRGAKIFSVLDLNSGFWQVPLHESSKGFTAFSVDGKLYEFNYMPFGLCNAPATFNRMMVKLLSHLPFCMTYVDDIVVFSEGEEQHKQHLAQIFRLLQDAGLKLNYKKCKFFQSSVKFLGFVISQNGITPDPEKVKAVTEIKEPVSVKGVKSVMGLFSYYRRFIKNFAEIAEPLTRLTRKDVKFEWTSQCSKSFEVLKALIVKAPILKFPDPKIMFQVETDASAKAIGAVLTQKGHPVAFASRLLNKAEERYSTTDREALAIVWATIVFRPYIYGVHFEIVTDHNPLIGLRQSKNLTGRQARWYTRLDELDYDIRYRKGALNGNADALSRVPVYFTSVSSRLRESVISGQQHDDQCSGIVRAKENGQFHKSLQVSNNLFNNISVVDGVVYFQEKLLVPKDLRDSVLNEFHCNNGHRNFLVSLASLQRSPFWWPFMRQDLDLYIKACLKCQVCKTYGKITTPMQELPKTGAFDTVAIDIVGPLPTSRGYSHILSIQDHFTKWVELVPMTSISAEAVSTAFIKHWVYRLGPPVCLHSDRGAQFESDVLAEVCKIFNIQKSRTTAYHPQGNGILERFHRFLKDQIRIFGGQWVDALPHIRFMYNITPHSSTGASPWEIVFGFAPQIPHNGQDTKPSNTCSSNFSRYIVNLKDSVRKVYSSVKERLQSVGTGDINYRKQLQAGDMVLKIREVRSSLQNPWTGPHEVQRIMSPTVVLLKDIGTVHISKLKKLHTVSFHDKPKN